MDFNWKTFAVAAVVLAGCSSDHTPNSDPTRISNPAAAAQAGAAGVGSTTGSPPTGFGNSNAQPQQGPAVANDAGGVPVSDGSACVIGKFCASTNADQGCGTITFGSTVKMVKNPGLVLLVWDRSTSMTQDWNGMARYTAAGPAMIAALMPLANDLTIGGIFFPSEKPGADDNSVCIVQGCSCSVEPYTSAEQLAFQPGAQALQKIQGPAPSGAPNPMYGPVGMMAATDPNGTASLGQTPTSEAIAAADAMLQSSTIKVGTSVAVIIVTDGEPNCRWDQTASTNVVSSWSKLGIKTYVVGLPSNDINANGKAVLNALAQAGGTMQYIDPSNAASLQQQLNSIVSTTITSGFDSCAIDLMPPTSSPDKLQLVVEETSTPGVQESVPHDLGWTVNTDGSHVELSGGLCDAAKSGQFSKITFTFGCKDIPPLPPDHVH
jgi:hypothetical protein